MRRRGDLPRETNIAQSAPYVTNVVGVQCSVPMAMTVVLRSRAFDYRTVLPGSTSAQFFHDAENEGADSATSLRERWLVEWIVLFLPGDHASLLVQNAATRNHRTTDPCARTPSVSPLAR